MHTKRLYWSILECYLLVFYALTIYIFSDIEHSYESIYVDPCVSHVDSIAGSSGPLTIRSLGQGLCHFTCPHSTKHIFGVAAMEMLTLVLKL